jgi:hypothetical protein
MTVSEMFEQYRINVAVCDSLLIELRHHGSEVIEALQLSAYCLSHVPRSETNRIHQPTEALALNLTLTIDSINQGAIKAFKELTRDIQKVDNLVNKLNEREQFVVKEKYIKGSSWREMLEFTEKNNLAWAKGTLKSDKKKAEVFLQKAINEQVKIGKFIREVAV